MTDAGLLNVRATDDPSPLEWSPDASAEMIAAAEALVDVAPAQGVVVQDRSGDIVGANATATEMLGLTADRIFHRTSHDTEWAALSESGRPLRSEEHPAMVTLTSGHAVHGFLMGVHIPKGSNAGVRFPATTRWLEIDSRALHAVSEGAAVDVRLLGVVATFVDVSNAPRGRAASANLVEAYRLLADTASDAVFLVNGQGTIEWASPGVERILGWWPERLQGRPMIELIHPEDATRLRDVKSLALASGGPLLQVELRLATSDGSWRWMVDAGRPMRDEVGVIVGGVDAFRDIHEHREAREALAEAARRHAAALDSLPDPFFVFDAVRDGHGEVVDLRYVSVNAAAEALYGRPAPEIIGRTLLELFPSAVEAGAFSCYIEPFRTGTTSRTRITEFLENGVEGSFDVAATPFGDGIIVVTTDIGAQVRAEAALAASEAGFQLLAENASDIVYMADRERRITWIAPTIRAALGWEVSDLLGRRISDLVHDDDVQHFEDHVAAVLAAQLVASAVPMQFRAKDGTYAWMSLRTSVIRNSDGEVDATVTGMRDVTALMRERDIAAFESAQRAAIVNSLLDPHVLLEAVRDADGAIVDFTYVEANEAACQYNGMSRDGLIGQRLLELLPGHAGAGLLTLYADVIELDRALILNDFSYPNEIQQGERYYDIRAVRVADSLSYTWRDVTERHQFDERMADSEMQFRLIAENSFDVVMRTRDEVVLWVSPSLERALGWEPEDWMGQILTGFVHDDDIGRLLLSADGIQAGEPARGRYRVVDCSGVYHWVDSSSSAYVEEAGAVDGLVTSFRLADDAVRAETDLERRATVDDLTGAYKRDAALARLAHTVGRQRRAGEACAVVFCDVDGFKQVNDTYGHAVGDELLRTVADRLRTCVRETDIVARMGGDEFLIILDGVGGLDEAAMLAENMRIASAEPVVVPGGEVMTTVSLGVTLGVPGEDVDTLIARADGAMYDAKASGRNRVVPRPSPYM